jgi:hypothetical protein
MEKLIFGALLTILCYNRMTTTHEDLEATFILMNMLIDTSNTYEQDQEQTDWQDNTFEQSKIGYLGYTDGCIKLLKKWLYSHMDIPYPTTAEKFALSNATGLTKTQISNWFSNARRRDPVFLKQVKVSPGKKLLSMRKRRTPLSVQQTKATTFIRPRLHYQ